MLSNNFCQKTVTTTLNGKKIIVSGCRGYVASSFLNGLTVYPFDEIQDSDATVFIHLGAKIAPSTSDMFQQNFLTDLAVTDFCAKNGISLIYASGNNVYARKTDCVETDDFPRASDYYALSKITGEQICFLNKDLSATILRIGDVFGKDQRHGNLFHAIQEKIEKKSPLTLYGDGQKIRNYIYIKELVEIIKFFVLNANLFSHRVYNVCFSTPYSVKKIISFLSAKTGLGIEEIAGSSSIDIRTMRNDALISSGYQFKYTMETALEDYLHDIG